MSSLLTSNYVPARLSQSLEMKSLGLERQRRPNRQVEEEPMFEMMNQQALSVGAERRHELAVETMRDSRVATGGARQALGIALVSFGQRVSGEMPARQAAPTEGDCA
jgi:hypothetical protein